MPRWIVPLAWRGFVLLALIAIAALVLADPGWPLVFRSTGLDNTPVVLRIFDEPCEHAAVLKHLRLRTSPEWMEKFKRAKLTWQSRDWESCWIDHRGYIHSMDEEGAELQPIPRSRFKDERV